MVSRFSQSRIATAEEPRQDHLRDTATYQKIVTDSRPSDLERDGSDLAEAAHQQFVKSAGYPGPAFLRWVSERLARLNGQSDTHERWPAGTI